MEATILIEEIQGPGKTGAGRFIIITALLFIPALAFNLY